jgi:conjugative relaxase-like TrwC/TraI family protein
MLSLAKLRVGQEAYQLSGVAQSLDDYYTGSGEAAGRWYGLGAERLGLVGDVDADDLRAVLAGMAPGTGGLTPDGATIRPHPRRVPGFDATFKVPKSASVLYAVSDDPRVQGAIIEAGDAALADTIAWLEREVIKVRRGTGNAAFLSDLAARDPAAADAARIRVLPGQGVTAAAFRHRTSRAGDPLLHWHVLIANLVEGPDGRWTAFVHPELYRAARAAGEVFQAVFRSELTDRLGLQWRAGRHVQEVAGVPQIVCDAFSKRSDEIEDWLAATGTPDTPGGRQQAVLATRRDKPEVEHERFDASWKAEAADLGWGPAAAEALLVEAASHAPRAESEAWRLLVAPRSPLGAVSATTEVVVGREEWIARLADELTAHESTFDRNDLVRAVATRLGPGATTSTIDRVAAQVTASSALIPIDDGRWTSATLVDIEHRLLHTATSSIGARQGLHPEVVAASLVGIPDLGADQAKAVRRLATSTDGVSLLVGPAGAGKTYALAALRDLLERSDLAITGVAPSARAAHELTHGAGITASTIHRQLAAWNRGDDLPNPRTVLVVDEAAMTGTRELEAVVSRVVTAGGRALLVGDYHQLPEVTAGGGFSALLAAGVTCAELTENRRQRSPWEREALTAIREGRTAAAIAAYAAHDRITVTADHDSMIWSAVERWMAEDGRAVLLAGTNETVQTLNTAVRAALREEGVLGPDLAAGAGRGFAVDDRVVARINDYETTTIDGGTTHLLNGQAGRITRALPAGGLAVLLDDGDEVVVPHHYLAIGGLDHGYALTAHRAQGGTWDVSISVGSDGLYREAGYLMLSRGRHANWLHLAEADLDDLDDTPARHDSPIPLPSEEPIDVLTALHDRLATSRAKSLAIVTDPHLREAVGIASHLPLATLEQNLDHARTVEDLATRTVGAHPGLDGTRLDRIDHTARHVGVGSRIRATDRNNIGTVVSLDDALGVVRVAFVAADGRYAERNMTWEAVEVMTDGPERELGPAATRALHRQVEPLHDRIDRWHSIVRQHSVGPQDRPLYERAIHIAVGRSTDELAADRPQWLLDLLGDRPASPAGSQVWDDAVTHLAAHRLRHGIDTDHEPPLGTPADIGLDTLAQLGSVVISARTWMDDHATTEPTDLTHRAGADLGRRKDELEAILATAPPDHRDLITRLQSDGQLPLDGLDDALRTALDGQSSRRTWILEHWPHVVEYAEVVTAAGVGPVDHLGL